MKQTYFIKMNNNSNILYTNKIDSKINGEFKKDNLENVKELNYHKLSNKLSYYKDLPLRNYREKCFKCQRRTYDYVMTIVYRLKLIIKLNM